MQNTEQTQLYTRPKLAKIDKSQYTKEQWHKIREQRRREKEQQRILKAQENVITQEIQTLDNKGNYVVCLKHGNKYSADYVNNLYNMVNRNITIPFEFVCFTEDPLGINENNIRIFPLPKIDQVHGWWYKPMFFNRELPIKGNILYMDLDVVVFRNIDKLFTYCPDKFAIIRDFNRSLRKDWRKMNSSVFRFTTGHMHYLYDEFVKSPKSYIGRLQGDQDYIYEKTNRDDFVWWPDEWIMSYKWEMRDRRDLIRTDGKRNFVDNKDPEVKADTMIAVFHGDPHPHEVTDKWVVDRWK